MEQVALVLSDARTAIAATLLTLGAVLLILAVVAHARAPDFYSRLHAVAPTYSLGGLCMLAALAIEAWDGQFTLRVIVLGVLLTALGPALSHMLANAAHAAGLAPRVGKLGDGES
jgi:multicomponent Na+:H+ antiporter subunit G